MRVQVHVPTHTCAEARGEHKPSCCITVHLMPLTGSLTERGARLSGQQIPEILLSPPQLHSPGCSTVTPLLALA